MRQDLIAGAFCHDLAILVIHDKWPALVHGTDYFVLHPVAEDGTQSGPPWIMFWHAEGIEQPTIEDLEAVFKADENRYRSALARHYRDTWLQFTDAKVTDPPDAPKSVNADVDAWKVFRQALREVPQQAGFPLSIDWPALPAE
jgi:hypothetical protein